VHGSAHQQLHLAQRQLRLGADLLEQRQQMVGQALDGAASNSSAA
jgi:hypothetical protein